MRKFITGLLIAGGLIISPVASASTLTNEQVNAVIVLLEAFGVASNVVEDVRLALEPQKGEVVSDVNSDIEEPIFGTGIEPVINVSFSQEASVSGTTITMIISGDWEKAKTTMHRPDGKIAIGSGYDTPDSEGLHIWGLNNMPSGTYSWEVKAIKNGVEVTVSGMFVVE